MTQPAGPSDIARFKDAFRLHPAGVAIVAGRAPGGLAGLTLSSVASVSADPPVLSFSVTRATGSAGAILNAGIFVVNLLAVDQAAIASSFAITNADRFTAEQGWAELPTGEPYLPGAMVSLRCTIRETLPVGPSVMVLANVLEAVKGTGESALIFRDRTFLDGAGLAEVN